MNQSALFPRVESCAMIWARSASEYSVQRSISCAVRRQPKQSPSAGFSTQTRVQGVAIALGGADIVAKVEAHAAWSKDLLATAAAAKPCP